MPEGPEIKRLADHIRAHVLHQEIVSAEFGVDAQKQYESILPGLSIEGIETYGKAIVFHFSAQMSMFTHTMMYGRWYVLPVGEVPLGSKKLGVLLHTSKYSAQLYSTKRIEVLETQALEQHNFLSKLGPDVLHEHTTAEMIKARLMQSSHKAIGDLLLDQSCFCGVGNYLRSEILFVQGLRPERTPDSLGDDVVHQLAQCILHIARRSYTAQGFTTDVAHMEQGLAQGRDRKSLKRYVYKHGDEPCPKCGTTIQEMDFHKRRVFICPSCQPES